jgi:hypothetical protein
MDAEGVDEVEVEVEDGTMKVYTLETKVVKKILRLNPRKNGNGGQ